MDAEVRTSILIPAYNRETLIGPCIESALNQTVTDLEVVVVDNASSDGTWEVCRSYAARDPRVRIFRNDANLGPVRNWQRCIAEARGRFGKILFSDDLMAPDFLEKTLPYLDAATVGFVFTGVVVGEEPWQGKDLYRYCGPDGVGPAAGFIRQTLFDGRLPLSPGCALFRMDDLKVNLKTEIPSPSIHDFHAHGAGPDMLLYLLTARRYDAVAYVPAPLSFFRDHPGSITVGDKEKYLRRCYRQARVWFAENYLPAPELGRYLAYEWRRERRETRQSVRPAAWLKDYSTQCTRLRLADMLWTVYYKYVGKYRQVC